MTPSETALKNCCCLANAKKESVSLTHIYVAVKVKGPFSSVLPCFIRCYSHTLCRSVQSFTPGLNLRQRVR